MQFMLFQKLLTWGNFTFSNQCPHTQSQCVDVHGPLLASVILIVLIMLEKSELIRAKPLYSTAAKWNSKGWSFISYFKIDVFSSPLCASSPPPALFEERGGKEGLDTRLAAHLNLTKPIDKTLADPKPEGQRPAELSCLWPKSNPNHCRTCGVSHDVKARWIPMPMYLGCKLRRQERAIFCH